MLLNFYIHLKLYFMELKNTTLKKQILLLVLGILFSLFVKGQNAYFPPPAPQSWDTISSASLGWCPERIDSLYQFLQAKNSKGFILLKDGKIVLEKYFGNYNADSLWYWASAGKTLTAFLIGILQQQGAVSLTQSVSQYIGNGWTSCGTTQEDSITLKNLLTMTSGLNDNMPPPCDNLDEAASCLSCLTSPSSRWAYHTGAYRKLHSVIQSVSGNTINEYTNQKVKSKTGMDSGVWFQGVYYSKLRDAARFGLLCLNRGIWQNDTILTDSSYFNAMTQSSQNLNLSYGYLTWLNGKQSYMIPQIQYVFNGSIISAAPPDMYAALGKNDQKIYVVPSQKLVVVRFGNAADTSGLALTTFDNKLWQKINDLNCSITSQTGQAHDVFLAGPNPFSHTITLSSHNKGSDCLLYDGNGKVIYSGNSIERENFETLQSGFYFLRIIQKDGNVHYTKLIKL